MCLVTYIYLEEISEPKEAQQEDSDSLFCKSLIDHLRRLPRRENQLVRIKIQQITFEAENVMEEEG